MKRIATLSIAGLLAACGGGAPDTRPANGAYADILDEARGCIVDADTPSIGLETFDSNERNPEVNAEASAAFIEMAAAGECVYELPSGLLFRIRNASDGQSPVSGDRVTVHYRGGFPNGVEFDSSYSRGQPATFPSDRLIAGWVEALPLMRTGERWELYITPELGYGARGTPGGPIAGNQALVFELELIDLPDAQPPAEDAEG